MAIGSQWCHCGSERENIDSDIAAAMRQWFLAVAEQRQDKVRLELFVAFVAYDETPLTFNMRHRQTSRSSGPAVDTELSAAQRK